MINRTLYELSNIKYILLSLLDYAIIISGNLINCEISSFILSIISEFIQAYFYFYDKDELTDFSNYFNKYIDFPMMIFLIYIYLFGLKNNIKSYKFFAIRDLTYHLIELAFSKPFYKKD